MFNRFFMNFFTFLLLSGATLPVFTPSMGWASDKLKEETSEKDKLISKLSSLDPDQIKSFMSLLEELSLKDEEKKKEKIIDKVINKDTRHQIKRPEEWPYCLFGLIDCQGGQGSGTLVWSNIVLTAAHVVYDRDNDAEEPLDSIFFFPGRDGVENPYGKIGVKAFFYPPEYKTDDEQDWALLALEKDIGYEISKQWKQSGWFKLRSFKDKDLKDHSVYITGYPGEKNNELYEIKGNINTVQKGLLGYELDTTPGQSGGGVWTEIKGKKYLVGTHQSGSKLQNWATRWTEDKNKIFLEFCQKYYSLEGIKNFCFEKPWEKCILKALDEQPTALHLPSDLDNQLGDEGIKFLSQQVFPRLIKLNELGLTFHGISSKGVKSLSNLTNLKTLFMDSNPIGDGGVEILSGLTQLTYLSLGFCKVKDKGALALSSLVNLKSLNLLSSSLILRYSKGLDEKQKKMYSESLLNKISETVRKTLREKLVNLTYLQFPTD